MAVDLTEKKPDTAVLPDAYKVSRPPSVLVQTTYAKPKITFTYTSPDPKTYLNANTLTPMKLASGQTTTVNTEKKATENPVPTLNQANQMFVLNATESKPAVKEEVKPTQPAG